MSIHQLEHLMQLYADRSLNELEAVQLVEWLKKADPQTEEELAQLIAQYEGEQAELPADWMRSVERIVATDRLPVSTEAAADATIQPVRRQRRLAGYSIAACIVALIAGGIFWLTSTPAQPQPVAENKQVLPNDALPGTNGAVLILADGSKVVLDSLGNGIVANQQGATVSLQDGNLEYKADKGPAPAVVYNTMTTPRGRQFRLTLPDGSRVWMNAASSLRFPTQFTGATRLVVLSGEAYFEVAANKQQPFQVQLNDDQLVEVTGTHFNVKAYADEADTKTTLLEGAVSVRAGEQQRMMKPGEQTRISKAGVIKPVPGASTEQAIAWMSRSFSFKSEDMGSVLRQLARWYDVEVKFEGPVPQTPITSNISMENNLSDILLVLAQSGLKCSLENGVLRVL